MMNRVNNRKNRHSGSPAAYYFDVISGRRATPAATLLRAALCVPAYCLWLPASALVRFLRLCGPCRPYRPPCPVISVGNITAGGAGKTPMTEWVCRRLIHLGRRPAILTHDYRPGDEAANEETMLLKGRFEDVPVLSGKNRSTLVRGALAEDAADCMIIDDGFQHAALARDLDIVLVDCLQPFGFGHPLPRGLLREPVGALRRAGIIVLTRSDQISAGEKESIRSRIARLDPALPVAEAVHRPVQLFEAGTGRSMELGSLADMEVMIFSAIGNPSAFEKTVQSIGADIKRHFVFRDHHSYKAAELDDILKEAARAACKAVITTEKDYIKVKNHWPGHLPLHVLRVELQVVDGEKLLKERIESTLVPSDRGPA